MFGVLIPLETMHPSPVLIYKGLEIFEKSWRRGERMKIFLKKWKYNPYLVGAPWKWRISIVFSFVMMYGLSSNNVLYSTSNQFLYANKKLLYFLNIKQKFSFMNWFLCLSHIPLGQHREKWNKNISKMRECPGYISDCPYKRGLNILHTML